jgi:GTP cyclohydrolase I
MSDQENLSEPISGKGQNLDDQFPDAPEELSRSVETMIDQLVTDSDREGLEDTPERVASAMEFLTDGYNRSPEELFEGALFEIEYDEMVIVEDIDFYSLCEHHLLPFYGQAHIAYIPDQRVVGLSKLSRLVDLYARRLQVQERLTTQVAETIQDIVEPKGVGVVVEGHHLCMMMRGVQKQNAKAVTSSMLDLFRRDSRTRMEFLELLDVNRV